MLVTAMLALAVGGGTYLYAKKRQAPNSTAAVAGVVTGAGTVAAATVFAATWPLLFLVGVPAAAIYYYGKSKGQRALPPGRG
jgi:hypothetical protein